MSQDPEELSKWIQELVSRSSRQQIQAFQRLSGLMQRVTSGDLNSEAIREEYARFIRDESSSFVEDLTKLGLSFQTALLELNRKYSERFFDQVLGSSMPEAQPTDGQVTRPREIGVVLSGAVGEELVRSFVIENKRNEEETVTFLISEFTDEASGESFRPPLQMKPPRLALRSGEERMVSIQLPLLPELFKPDHIYDATILARGHVDVLLSLRIEVSAPELFIKVEPEAPTRAGLDVIIHEQPARKDTTAKPTAVKGVGAKPTTAKKSTAKSAKAPAKPAARRAPRRARRDDLTLIKGIGPAYAAVLNEAGIITFAGLSELNPDRLVEILGEAGGQRAEREGWVEQAILATGSKGAGLGEYWHQVAPGSNGDRS